MKTVWSHRLQDAISQQAIKSSNIMVLNGRLSDLAMQSTIFPRKKIRWPAVLMIRCGDCQRLSTTATVKFLRTFKS